MADKRRAQPKVKLAHYILGKTLGFGTFGKVKVGIHQITNCKVAVKIISREKLKVARNFTLTRREIQNFQLFDHLHIIKLYQVISAPTDIFIIMEYGRGGDLKSYIKAKRLVEGEARRFFQQIIAGVDYLHQNLVVHRDLKPENILLDSVTKVEKNIKIADFGLSCLMEDGGFLHSKCGSPYYAAPELIVSKEKSLYPGPEVDIWSCGIILYFLLCGRHPYESDNVRAIFNKIKAGIQIPPSMDPDASELLRHMIQWYPIKRPTMREIRDYEWFKKDLPDNLFPPSDQDALNLKSLVVEDICQHFNVDEDAVDKALEEKDPHNQIYSTYNLSLDNVINRGKCYNKKPQDLMDDIYKAMKELNYEWATIDTWHCRVRKLNPVTLRHSELSFQLFRFKGYYLLDFKSINTPANSSTVPPENLTEQLQEDLGQQPQENLLEQPPENLTEQPPENLTEQPQESLGKQPEKKVNQHQILEFIEMCSSIIRSVGFHLLYEGHYT